MAGCSGGGAAVEASAATSVLLEAASCAICGSLFDCPLLLRSCGHSCEQSISANAADVMRGYTPLPNLVACAMRLAAAADLNAACSIMPPPFEQQQALPRGLPRPNPFHLCLPACSLQPLHPRKPGVPGALRAPRLPQLQVSLQGSSWLAAY